MYFCFWKVLSRAFRWRSENTARRSMPLLGFPRGASGQENVPGIGTTEEEAGGTKHMTERWTHLTQNEGGKKKTQVSKCVKQSSKSAQHTTIWSLSLGDALECMCTEHLFLISFSFFVWVCERWYFSVIVLICQDYSCHRIISRGHIDLQLVLWELSDII